MTTLFSILKNECIHRTRIKTFVDALLGILLVLQGISCQAAAQSAVFISVPYIVRSLREKCSLMNISSSMLHLPFFK